MRLLSGRAPGVIPITALVALLSTTAACSAILGDFSESQILDDGGTPPTPDSSTPDTFVPPPPDDGGGDTAPPADGGVDAPKDGPIEVGPPGRPGFALTGGGTVSASAGFKVFAAVGESPGGNITAASPSYKIQSGVIGATQ